MKYVYSDQKLAKTLYCGLPFDTKKNINVTPSVTTSKYEYLLSKVEFEHIVPISWIGQSYSEWRDGHPDCIDSKGNSFKGRGCAGKTNLEYRYAEADAYNLYPASGAVNRLRSNYSFELLPASKSDFGSCLMKIDGKRVEPPELARGIIARASLYMAKVYPRYRISKSQVKLFNAWDRKFPVTLTECIISKRTEQIQGNSNMYTKEPCQKANYW
jgi:deoxyribonuclease-1